MGKVDENKLQKQQSLFDTAYELFTTQGVAKTSISDIVDRAGVAKGTFYLYFRDKFDLEERLIMHKSKDIFEHAMERTRQLAASDLQEFVICLINDIIDSLEKDPKLLRFINKNLSWGIFRRSMNRSETDYMSMFVQMASAGPVRYREPRLLLYTIIEFVSSTCHNLILEHDPVDMDTYRPYLNRTLRAIIESYREE